MVCLVSSKSPKKSEKYRKKIVKGFARISENFLIFYRPQNTFVAGANFCGCLSCDPSLKKNIKQIVKKRKSLIPTSAFWENPGKIQKKKNLGLLLVLSVIFSIILCFHLIVLRLDTS